MNIDWLITGLTALVILVATVVHGIAGFGLAQVSMGLMPLFRSTASASVVFSIVAVASNARIWWSVRDDFDWRKWLFPVIGLAVGLPLGILVFSNLGEAQLKIAVGITLLLAVILIVVVRQISAVQEWFERIDLRPGWKTGVVAGFLAGVLGGAVAIPGPPMILYGAFMVANELWEGAEMKATFTAFFGTLMLYRVVSLLIAGQVTLPLAVEAAIALPALFLGSWLGIKIYNVIPQHIFRWIVLGMLTVNAVILLVTALSG